MDDDAIAALGHLALGTRLKRIAEHLQAGVADALLEEGVDILPGQLPLLTTIDAHDGLTIAELVSAIGTSQPAISRTIGLLRRAGHVSVESDVGDARVRRVRLTARARALLARLRSGLFPKVEAAARELCTGLDLLDSLAAVDQRNRQLSFAGRIARQA